MHMADALLSPAVAGTMWVASAAVIACCSTRLRRESDDRLAPLMGVVGAFLFAVQMVNFSIPGTGSSGHLSGGLLLAILLGPSAAFLTVASVLVVQSLFFADGGLLALGCNIFNLGAIPAFLAYPLVYRTILGAGSARSRLPVASVTAAVVATQLGSLAVVLETSCSAVSVLPFSDFLLLMQPIHLAIGVIEGAVTCAVVSFVLKARPDLLRSGHEAGARAGSRAPVLVFFAACAVIAAGCLSFLASDKPDGLEWSVTKVAGGAPLRAPQDGVSAQLARLQQKMSWFAGYSLPKPRNADPSGGIPQSAPDEGKEATALAGLVGAAVTLLAALAAGLLLRKGGRGAVLPQR